VAARLPEADPPEPGEAARHDEEEVRERPGPVGELRVDFAASFPQT
jgi:hypothetical protein